MLGVNCSFSDSQEWVMYTVLFPRRSSAGGAELPCQQLPLPVHLQGSNPTTAHGTAKICASASQGGTSSFWTLRTWFEFFSSLKWNKISLRIR